jgi:ABC-type sugar transport system ATPase subunit/ribose/xylose/arabinose/galactoside ABC-type transport system permease subunit
LAEDAVLEINKIVKSFGGTVALRDVSLEVQPGEFHALLGENGAGKSTLVKIVSGVYSPDKGNVCWEGQKITSFSPSYARRLGIGIVHQDSALLPDFSVAANFGLGREPVSPLSWVVWDAVKNSLKEQSARFQVAVSPDTPVRSLSVGMRKLLDIMRVLQDAQKLIILDEPTAAFTVEDTKRLMEILWEIKNAGTSIIYVTHRLQEIEEIVDQVTVLKDGASVGTLTPEEATPERIVSLMVGRKIGDMYPAPSGESPTGPALQIRGFTRGNAFHDVNIEAKSGEIIALVGLAGHGAFETAHSIYGNPPADSGELIFHGKSLKVSGPRIALQEGIGLVTEDRAENVLRVLSVRENLSLAALKRWSLFGWINTILERANVAKLMESLNIKARGVGAPAESLSGGNQQKVVLGRWLAAETKLLVLLDPTAGVDVGARAEIYKLLRKLADEGRSVLIATSDMSEALGLADRIYAFYRGTVVGLFTRHDRHESQVLAAITGHAVEGMESAEASESHIDSMARLAQPVEKPELAGIQATATRSEPIAPKAKQTIRMTREAAPMLLMLSIFALAMLFVPNFSGSGNLRNVLVQSVPLLLTAVGQTLVIITAGIDLSVGETVTFSTILASSLMGLDLIGIPLGVITCLLAGTLIGVANALMIGRLNLPPFLATLATMFCLQGLNLYLRPVPGGFVPREFRLIATARLGSMPIFPVIVVLLLGMLAFHFARARFGLQAHAVGADETRARLSGVSLQRVKLSVYVISSALASIAGLFLAARTGSGDPQIGSTYMFDSITATVLGGASLLGGLGTLWGALGSGLILAMLANILNLLGVVTYWQWIIRGAILVLAVAGYSIMDVREKGIATVLKQWLRKLNRPGGESESQPQ